MGKIKASLLGTALVVLISMGFLLSVPSFIPSLQFVQFICILIVYLLLIGLSYIIILHIRNYLFVKYSVKVAILCTKLSALIIVISLFFSFLLTSINVNKAAFSGNLVNEMYFPVQKVKLYIYDESSTYNMTTIKIKNRNLPVMENLSFIENSRPASLKCWRHHDTVAFVSKTIELKIDLKTRKIIKTYLKKTNPLAPMF